MTPTQTTMSPSTPLVRKLTTLSSQNKGIAFSSRAVTRFLNFRGFFFHLITFVWHVLLNYQCSKGINEIFEKRMDLVEKTCGFGIQYITIWNQLIQQTYFGACLLEDILEFTPAEKYTKLKRSLKTILSATFASIVVPLAFLVLINFWPIYSVNPSIIDEYDVTASYFPLWVNHGLHTTIVFLVLVEKFLVYRSYPNTLWGITGVSTIVWGYALVVLGLYLISGFWPYPLLKIMNNFQRIFFLSGNLVFGFFVFVMGGVVNRKIWGGIKTQEEHIKSS